ncbi:MAG: polysaccharide deacetylase family protein [Oscillospiraceae bacterium]|nr:polysaccharide deacetylase family protein [Oscillospiraceae bacterium]
MYFGSVRFFKNLILLTVIILITVPTVLAVRWGIQLHRQQHECERLSMEMEQQRLSYQEELDQMAALETAAEVALNEMIQKQAEEQAKALTPEKIAYQQMYPDFYAPQELGAVTNEENVIYLTFDDGPSNRTPEILDILREKNVKATFFVVGQSDEERLQWMKQIVDEGHTIGMHTYTHQYKKIYASVEAYLEDMYAIFTQIRETTGVTPTVFRFAGGSINNHNHGVYREIIAEMLRRGFVPHDWNVASADASSTPISSAQLLYNVVSGAQRVKRGVVLMHDSEYKYTTVEALPSMIDQLQEMGFKLDSLHENTQPILFSYPE